MPATAQFAWGLESDCLEVDPIGRVAGDLDSVLVAEHDAGAIEGATNGGIEFPRDLGLGAPDSRKDGGNIDGRDLVHGPVEERT